LKFIAETPKPPYYAVIFTFKRTPVDNGFEGMEKKTSEMVSKMKGFLGAENTKDENGFGVLISYWDSEESINAWRSNQLHRSAKDSGRDQWFSEYATRICKVEYDYFSE
jgi:heme-degrading monooxygenase HmoA